MTARFKRRNVSWTSETSGDSIDHRLEVRATATSAAKVRTVGGERAIVSRGATKTRSQSYTKTLDEVEVFTCGAFLYFTLSSSTSSSHLPLVGVVLHSVTRPKAVWNVLGFCFSGGVAQEICTCSISHWLQVSIKEFWMFSLSWREALKLSAGGLWQLTSTMN